MKRWAALCLCVLLSLLLCACGAERAIPLQCGELDFSAGEYAYLLHSEMKAADDGATREELLQRTDEECRFYAALQTRMDEEGLRLSAPHKSEVASRTRGLWQYYAAHYRALGMNKSDLTKIETFEEAKKALTEHLFGAGGAKEVKESKLKQWFNDSFVGYRAFSESLTKTNAGGETAPLSDSEQAALVQTFEDMKKRADSGTTMDSLSKEYNKSKGLLATSGTEVTVVKKGDPTVGEAFFAAVQELKTDETAVLRDGSRLTLVQRIDLLADDTPYFAEERDAVLFEKKWPDVEKELKAQAETLKTQTDERLCGEIYAQIKAAQ